MRAIIGWGAVLALVGLLSCKKDKPAPTASNCAGVDTLRITYQGYVADVMRQHCTSCHGGSSPSASLALETYAQVRASAESGRWYEAMSRGQMPPSGKLDECTLAKLNRWIDLGYPEQ
ncbi:MAG: hypothetical protein N3A68_02625 [Bacteroidia bacterium]|nr:hypothetical protein [Bacteroidia bacterium]GIV23170.1 MAG: hypothetical protein KatS3mg025_0829 [Bacteroidia bacterium]